MNPSASTGPDASADPAPPDRRSFASAVVSIWLGTTLEYVDFALYGLAAGLVFGDVFFPTQTPVVALLSAFATYAVGFVARPVGAVVLGRLGDRVGRRRVMIITVALMGLATTGIGLVPSYASIGWVAPGLLVLLRLTQGFGAGAELSGGAVMLAEYAPTRRRGLVASLVGVGSNSGTLLASLVWLAVLTLPREQLIAWGWRVPFLASVLVAALALVLRRTMRESPVYTAFRARRDERLARVGDETAPRSSGRAFLIMLGLRIGENGPSYIAQSFLVGYVVKVLGVDKSVPTRAVLVASVLGFAVIPVSGWLSDRFGRRITYRTFCVLLMIYAFPAFAVLQHGSPFAVGTVIVVGMALGSLGIFGVQAAYGVELFGVQHRYSQMALAKELGSILSGGTAPLVASALLATLGSWVPLAAYFAVMAGIGFVTTLVAPETRGRDLTAVQDAV